ncbi:hypothetical protein BTW15_02100 [Pseudomonas syringae pv. tomato]|uniref:Uncharacterized protein n=5 Tax=Pseudomonas syringae group TaxID=136849 RepID=A0A0P9ZPE7_PSESX|nr:hypothetical protein XJ28_17255 [Pseudomonas syringae pv. tomato]EEB58238.1 hypothetical protein PSPTOT1_3977 [Pseudomonas syringae pv. tomato T1]KPB95685.1 Uncharacterized protein AC503_3009 [Pseudomonas syringae pv. maculicola]KPW57221.1 Uncharacterized protein ALO86_04832 [Pseudomonas syringae pv. berberidis]KPY63981.1 Uncharacterized protein ALO94_00132 [Pseudomonas syringae pv. spinaceae]MCF5223844.1 hypothetical protein [Pseudomonas syringae]RMN42087.1 hypothetical protein ALQ59_0096
MVAHYDEHAAGNLLICLGEESALPPRRLRDEIVTKRLASASIELMHQGNVQVEVSKRARSGLLPQEQAPGSEERGYPMESSGGGQTDMTSISIDADIKAKWPQGHCSHSPGTPEELMIIAVDLLIKELGTDGARSFIGQVLSRYAAAKLPA